MDRRSFWICIALAAIYIAASMQHPILNFDDIGYAYFYQTLPPSAWPDTAKSLFLATGLPNEYRTFSLARLLQYGLWLVFGAHAWPYHLVMAATWAASAALIYAIIRRLEERSDGVSRPAMGAAVIWLFSPFSLCRTFHHWSYVVLPVILLLAYVYLTLHDRVPRARVALLPIAALCGEMVIPALIVCSVLLNRRHLRRMFVELAILLVVLVLHFMLLHAVNGYAGGQRFSLQLQDASESLAYFLSSIGATIGRAFQISVRDYEPYFPGLRVHGWAWREINAGFFALIAILCTLCGLIWRQATAAMMLRDRLIALTAAVASLWALFVVMVFTTKLYGQPFALQVRYGYVVLPATLALVFLCTQQAGPIVRAAGALIPVGMIVGWCLNMAVVYPAQAHVDRQMIRVLQRAAADGVRTVATWQPEQWPYRPYGMLNPFVITADTPFQQDWTGDIYTILVTRKLDIADGVSGVDGDNAQVKALNRLDGITEDRIQIKTSAGAVIDRPRDSMVVLIPGADSARRPQAPILERLGNQ